jgi:hypothetical protein
MLSTGTPVDVHTHTFWRVPILDLRRSDGEIHRLPASMLRCQPRIIRGLKAATDCWSGISGSDFEPVTRRIEPAFECFSWDKNSTTEPQVWNFAATDCRVKPSAADFVLSDKRVRLVNCHRGRFSFIHPYFLTLANANSVRSGPASIVRYLQITTLCPV